MRKFSVHVWRTLVGLSIFAAGWAPAALITVWGGSYFLRCVNTLTAPGVPVEYRYESASGTMLVRAAGYQFDPQAMEGFFSHVSVHAPQGEIVAKCAVADFAIEGGVFTLRMSNPDITVNRLKDGSFDVQHMMPAEVEDKASEAAFRVSIRNAHIKYHDPAVSEKSVDVQLDQLVADGSNGVIAFRANVFTNNFDGAVFGSATKSDGLVVSIELANANISELLPHINTFLHEDTVGEFAHITAKSLSVKGGLTLAIKENQPLKINADLKIEGDGIQSPQTFHRANLTASIKADGTNAHIVSTINQQGLNVEFDGYAQMQGAFRLVGNLNTNIQDRQSLPPQVKPFIPLDALFENATYKGTIDTDGEKFLLDGKVEVDQIDYAGETTTHLIAIARLSERGLDTQIDQAQWAGIEYTGALQINFDSGKVGGGIQSRRGRLDALAKHFGTDRLSGFVSTSAILGGTVDNLYADVYARGSGGVKVGEDSLTSLGVYEVRGRLNNEGVRLDRLEVSGPHGLLVGSGFMDWKSGNLAFEAKGGGLDLSSAIPEAKGLGFLNITVGGTKAAPTFNGRAEVYGIEAYGRKVPQAVADFKTSGRVVDFERFAIRAGTGQVEGDLKINLDSQTIEGNYSGKGIRLEEWLANETVGSANIIEGKIFGTLTSPASQGTIQVDQFFASGINVKGATLPYTIDKDHFATEALVINVQDGTIEGSAEYLFGSGNTSSKGSFKNLPLEYLSLESNALTLDGLVSGNFEANRIDEKWISSVSSDLTDVTVNKTRVGQGWLEFNMNGLTMNLDGQVGSIERYILASGLRYDLESKNVAGDALIYNILMEDVLAVARKSMSDLPDRLKDVAANTSGLLNADISVSGTASDPNLDVKTVNLSDLKLRGRDAGEIRVGASRSNGLWDVQKFEWEQGDTRFTTTGTISEEGHYDLIGDLNNFDASWIHTWMPEVPLFTGGLDVSFRSSGSFENPTGVATLVAHNLGYFDEATAVTLPLSVELDEVTIRDRAIALHGMTSYQGLSAEVSGVVPFANLYGDKESRDVLVTANIDERPLTDLSPFVISIDKDRTAGDISGVLGLRGGWETLELFADLHTKGTLLAFNGQSSVIKDFDFAASLHKGGAVLKGSFSGGQGGKGTVSASATLPDSLMSGDVDRNALMNSAINGKVELDKLLLTGTLPTAEKESRITITTQGMTVSGTLGAPRIAGDLLLESVYIRLPSELEESTAPVIYEIDPLFEGITVTAAPGSQLDSGNARIDFFGKGRLGGSLQNPDISLPLKVSGGVFRLPTARIDLENNGEITIGYRASLGSAPTARVDLHLEGNTTVSARRLDNQYETYPVQLDIRGNLLEESGLTITAVSDPPDLSSDQIMAILGRKELIENFARAGSQSSLQESFYSAALPAAANMVTSGLANDLGLDYITLDYNPLDQAIAGVGKSFGQGLMVHANRQLSSSAGERLKYEVQLTYRLPMQDRFFSRIRVGFGADQDVPWRLRLNWARRF